MRLTRLMVENFSAFERAELEFSSGLNVLIGANGTGKTHLLKLLYASTLGSRVDDGRGFPLAFRLNGVFLPDDHDPGRLVRRGTAEARIVLDGSDGPAFEAKLTADGGLVGFPSQVGVGRPLFLPSREVLAMYEGFIHAYESRELAFDRTYYDACVALNANPLKGEKRKSADRLNGRLVDAIQGRVELRGGRFYVQFTTDDAPLEAHLVAEGVRKIASLQRLILNGSIAKGTLLFWDEPEANLNPRLTAIVSELLGVLVEEGVQLFLTTHDYLLARRIQAAARQGTSARFFCCYRARPGEPVEVAGADDLEGLPENAMAEEFARLYDLENAPIEPRRRKGRG